MDMSITQTDVHIIYIYWKRAHQCNAKNENYVAKAEEKKPEKKLKKIYSMKIDGWLNEIICSDYSFSCIDGCMPGLSKHKPVIYLE